MPYIHSLEEEINCPLFMHKGRHLVPLLSAYKLKEYTEKILQLTAEAISQTRLAAGIDHRRLKIGALYSLTAHVLPELIMDFKLRKPNIELDLSMGSNQELLTSLENNELDAIFIEITQNKSGSSQFEYVPIFKDELFLAGPIDSPLLIEPTLNLNTLNGQNFVCLNKGFSTYHSFHQAFANANYTPNIIMYVNDIFSLMNLVCGGIGYSLLPGRMKPFYQDKLKMVRIEQQNPVVQTIGLVFAKNREHDPNILSILASSRMYSINHSKKYKN